MHTPPVWIYATNPARPAGPLPRIGKWMLWLSARQIDSCWERVAALTEVGHLGVQAKRAISPNNRGVYLICVYTYDHTDRDDVGRVLAALRELGHHRRLLYKEDAATRAGLYGSGSSLYVAEANGEGFTQQRDAVANQETS